MEIGIGISLTRRRRRTVRPFIARLFANGEAGGFFRARASTMLSDGEPASLAALVDTATNLTQNTYDAVQTSDALKPVYGFAPPVPRRNLLTASHVFDDPIWALNDAELDELPGGGYQLRPVFSATNVAPTILRNVTFHGETGPRLNQVRVRPLDLTRIQLSLSSGITANAEAAGAALFEMTEEAHNAGTVIISPRALAGYTPPDFSLPVDDPEYNIWTLWVATDANPVVAQRRFSLSLVAPGAAASGSGASIRQTWTGAEQGVALFAAQGEASLSPTPIQRVETDLQWFDPAFDCAPPALFNTGGNRALNVTFPDLGEDATVAFVTEAGVTIQTGQTIGAGARNIMPTGADRLYAYLVSARALTADEATGVAAGLARLARECEPLVAPEPGDHTVFRWSDGGVVEFAANGDLITPDPATVNVVTLSGVQAPDVQYRQTLTETWLDARDGVFSVDIGNEPAVRQNPVLVDDGSDYVIIQGGRVQGQVDLEADWADLYQSSGTNSAAVYARNSSNILMRGWQVEQCWDGFRMGGTQGRATFQIESCYIHRSRDDALENERGVEGEVRDCLFDDVFSGISLTASDTSAPDYPLRQFRVFTVRDTMLRMRQYLRNGVIRHGAPFKMGNESCQLRLINTVVAIDAEFAEAGPNQNGARWSRLWSKLRPESAGNYLLNLSDTPLESAGSTVAAKTAYEGALASPAFTILEGEAARDFSAAWKADFFSAHPEFTEPGGE